MEPQAVAAPVLPLGVRSLRGSGFPPALGARAPAAITAVSDLRPDAFPLLAPGERPFADRAELLGEMGLLVHRGELPDFEGGGAKHSRLIELWGGAEVHALAPEDFAHPE